MHPRARAGARESSLSCAADRPYAEVVECASKRAAPRPPKQGRSRARRPGLLRPTVTSLATPWWDSSSVCTWVGGGTQLATAARRSISTPSMRRAARTRWRRLGRPERRRGLNYADPQLVLLNFDSAVSRYSTAHRGRTAPCHPRALCSPATVSNTREYFPAGTYPSLYSGRGVADHGLYYPLQWSYREQRVRHQDEFHAAPGVWNASPPRAFGPC